MLRPLSVRTARRWLEDKRRELERANAQHKAAREAVVAAGYDPNDFRMRAAVIGVDHAPLSPRDRKRIRLYQRLVRARTEQSLASSQVGTFEALLRDAEVAARVTPDAVRSASQARIGYKWYRVKAAGRRSLVVTDHDLGDFRVAFDYVRETRT